MYGRKHAGRADHISVQGHLRLKHPKVRFFLVYRQGPPFTIATVDGYMPPQGLTIENIELTTSDKVTLRCYFLPAGQRGLTEKKYRVSLLEQSCPLYIPTPFSAIHAHRAPCNSHYVPRQWLSHLASCSCREGVCEARMQCALGFVSRVWPFRWIAIGERCVLPPGAL